ncbi:hypothetical protein FEM48_Zijuj02G0061200 [Ziziphus jujuba var. spinosa]|uniref:DUF674 domain-containing protein n=1 Tax=Ziziphus jujuba var. spinosa TaxID=714518 RepID=A0A978VU26_ZIZJJ|nr:uncharacterized protein LOC107410925 [Ziziphus jujuba var. spinosa]KAH7542321.1 hypothetical protein FEM48_Zijuj02G0061200 [Ziziphus jujuba var. spinosa]
MANKQVTGEISLVVLVDKEKKRVIFAESDQDLVDILFSFLTIPVGTIIGLSSDKSAVEIGCMNNLYKSVENIDDKHFHYTSFKQMLLSPRNNADSHCSNLKLKIDHQTTRYFVCCNHPCSGLLSHYSGCLCRCGTSMGYEVSMRKGESKMPSFSDKDGGVFVKGLSRFIISDDLQVMPLSTAASLSLFSKLGIMDWSGIEKNIFYLGVGEVLNLLVCSLVSKTPLTETLLKHKPATELNAGNFDQGKHVEYKMEDKKNIGNGKITIKLMVSKSKKKVWYAEAKKDFVNLLFSFLTIPLGHFVTQKFSSSLNGCIDQLYKSVQDLDEQFLKSNYHKEMLVSPKLASGIGYENDLLGIEEASHPPYYFAVVGYNRYLTNDKSLIPSYNNTMITELKVVDPKSHNKDGGGFITGQAIFTVTDSLIIRPISHILGLSILNDLKVPFNDIEEQTVLVGKEEALSLLQTCFESESALTNTFIRDPKQCK